MKKNPNNLKVSKIHMQICHMGNEVPETVLIHNRFLHSPNKYVFSSYCPASKLDMMTCV